MPFPVLHQINLIASTTGGGQPLPSGETASTLTIGIRTDGDTTHGAGNYQWLVIVPATTTAETAAAINAAIGSALPGGDYWANAQQTDTYNGQNFTSAWGATEAPFSVPLPGVVPDAPQLSVS